MISDDWLGRHVRSNQFVLKNLILYFIIPIFAPNSPESGLAERMSQKGNNSLSTE